jgi:hypothetical protein
VETTEKYFIIAIFVIINKEIAKLIMLKNCLLQMNDIYDVQQTLSQAPKQISRKYYICIATVSRGNPMRAGDCYIIIVSN